MRSTEERILAVKLRAKEIHLQKRIQKGYLIGISTLTISLMIIVGLSFLTPSLMDSMSDGQYTNIGTAACMFEGNNYLGYLFVGFFAFALGISVTILSYKIKLKNQLDQEANDD